MADGGKTLPDIGRRITHLREALGHNQVSFSKLVGISQSGLANYEAGTRRPDIDQAIKIMNKTGATLDWIYVGERAGLPQRLLALIEEFDALSRKAG